MVCPHQSDRISNSNRAELEIGLLCLVNVHRIENGLVPLLLDTRLAAASRAHSEDMVKRDYFDHTSPDGRGPTQRARAAGYPSGVGENIAYASDGTIRTLFILWKGSSGHNQNMLGSSYRATAVGLAVGRPGGGYGITGGQLFGSSGANTGETGLPGEADGEVAGSKRGSCARAKRALAKKRRALRRADKGAPLERMRTKARKAKRRVKRACP